jgi:hypothetical protein
MAKHQRFTLFSVLMKRYCLARQAKCAVTRIGAARTDIMYQGDFLRILFIYFWPKAGVELSRLAAPR